MENKEYFVIYLVNQCVRDNTPLEDLHASGKISDEEMKSLMKAICNNVVGFLEIWNGSGDYKIPLPKRIIDSFGWDVPVSDFLP